MSSSYDGCIVLQLYVVNVAVLQLYVVNVADLIVSLVDCDSLEMSEDTGNGMLV